MSGMWLSRIIVLPYCEKGPWRRRWQRKPEDCTIVFPLLNRPIIQIFGHQIFDKIQLHQINRQLFLPKISKTSWAGCSPLVGNAPSQKILLWVQQIWKRGEGREKNVKTNMDFLECCICLLPKRNMNWPRLASPKYFYLGFQTHQEWQVQNYLACLPCQAATIFACRKIQLFDYCWNWNSEYWKWNSAYCFHVLAATIFVKRNSWYFISNISFDVPLGMFKTTWAW